MSDDKTASQAFPHYPAAGYAPGMELREYAAIRLRVPDSGKLWLDDMIRQSLRDEFAKNAMQGLIAQSGGTAFSSERAIGAQYAYEMADAMIEVRSEDNDSDDSETYLYATRRTPFEVSLRADGSKYDGKSVDLREDLLEVFADDPDHYKEKISECEKAFRAFADELLEMLAARDK